MADASQQVKEWGPYAVPPGRDVGAALAALSEEDLPAPRSTSGYRYPREPGKAAPAARPFHEQPNVLMTPHGSD